MGTYTVAVTTNVEEGTSVTGYGLVVPWTLGGSGDTVPLVRGAVGVDFVHEADGSFAWDGAVEATGASVFSAIFLRRAHLSSPDPFKLVHSSARGDQSVAAVVAWSGRLRATLQYVHGVPLRRSPGNIVFGRLGWPGSDFSVSLAAYGSERVQHGFVVVDGRATLNAWPVQWGAAWLSGTEAQGGAGPGLVVHVPVQDGAAFVRAEWRKGTHSGWVRIHATGPDFRSLAADTYPFSRGKLGVEGRWQWRVQTGKTFSTYAQRLQPLALSESEGEGPADFEVETSFSSMPRGRWGWRVAADGKTKEGLLHALAISGTLTDGSRRFEAVTGPSWRSGSVTWQHRLQWDAGTWRIRLLVDEDFGGWRGEWRVVDLTGWGWTIVYKQLFAPNPGAGAADAWMHIELRRRLTDFGELWLQYMEPDLGRLDVGWTRAASIVAGVRLSF